jgi:phosphotransferase system HPr (HPr) family protein
MVSQTLTVNHSVGLHARPATLFVKTAGAFAAELRIRNLTRASDWVSCKSILRILSLGVKQNHQIEVSAEGEDAREAIEAISSLVRSNFGEDEGSKG